MNENHIHKNGNIPLFVYGTLRSDRAFGDDVKVFGPEIKDGKCNGNLHWNLYINKQNKEEVTVALDPTGKQRVSGQLFYFKKNDIDVVYAKFDELEFNFSNLHISGRLKEKDRVYLRTSIKCTDHNGQIIDAYAYIYYARKIPISCLPLVKNSLILDHNTEYPEKPISVRTFRSKFEILKKKYIIPAL